MSQSDPTSHIRSVGASHPFPTRSDTSDRKPSDLVRSVSRAARILEEVGARPEGLTARRIATACNLNIATTYHLLRTLRYEQYVIQGPGHRYLLGPKIANQFRDLKTAIQRPPQVSEVLRYLTETTGQSAYYAQFVGDNLLITDVVEGPYSPHLEQLMIHCDEAQHATALGKALLWSLPRYTRQEHLRERGLRPFTSNTVVDSHKLELELHTLALRRVFIEQEQYRDNVCCGAVAIRHKNQTTGAIGMPSPVERWRRTNKLLIHQLRNAAADLHR